MRQTERRAKTRAALVRAAAAAFAERGYDGASIDAIAAAAGLSKGAVYANFPNKLDLYLAVIGLVVEEAGERFALVAAVLQGGGDPLTAASAYFRPKGDGSHAANLAELWRAANRHEPVRRQLEGYLELRRLAFSHAVVERGRPPAEALRLAATVERLIDAELLYRRLGEGAAAATVS